jgi:hypothetical protein
MPSCTSINRLQLKVNDVKTTDNCICTYHITGNYVNTKLVDTCDMFTVNDLLRLKYSDHKHGVIYQLNSIIPCEGYSIYTVKRNKSYITFADKDTILYDFKDRNKFRLIKL